MAIWNTVGKQYLFGIGEIVYIMSGAMLSKQKIKGNTPFRNDKLARRSSDSFKSRFIRKEFKSPIHHIRFLKLFAVFRKHLKIEDDEIQRTKSTC